MHLEPPGLPLYPAGPNDPRLKRSPFRHPPSRCRGAARFEGRRQVDRALVVDGVVAPRTTGGAGRDEAAEGGDGAERKNMKRTSRVFTCLALERLNLDMVTWPP